MNRLVRLLDTITRVGAVLASLAMISVVLLIGLEILLRSLFRTSTLIADEYSGYLMVSIVAFGLGHTLTEEGHIRITLLTSRLSPGKYRLLDTLTSFVGAVLSAFCTYHSFFMVKDTFSLGMRADSIAETPLFIPQIPVVAGFLFLTIAFVRRILQNLKPDYSG
ncbi:TRAP transporter small permease subunit [Thermodesulforhabdus norvegica]|uniref:TRAP-type C4-dicarboxylate transport system, small permease component n=1 Tax=Thermodesulforhabdus norvegica TaxID=39841 RepID=A0A1I4UHS6_9BACT|nr:TRAP transporter small permease [Thermodesulforhabdus norvegica]SFM88557.1 TRAP-type C4-dicarboxylate transport system, small permease component [Thermodesulforhabdus norvegica]